MICRWLDDDMIELLDCYVHEGINNSNSSLTTMRVLRNELPSDQHFIKTVAKLVLEDVDVMHEKD